MNIYKFYIEVSEWDNYRPKCGGFSSKSCLRTRKGNIGEKIPPGLESSWPTGLGIFHGSVDESLVFLLGKMWSCLGQRYLFKKLNIYRSTQGRTWKAYVPRKQPFKEKSWPCLWRKWYETLAIAAWVFAEKGCDASPRWHGLTRCMCPLCSSKTKYGHLSVLNLASGVISSMACGLLEKPEFNDLPS